MRSIKYSVVVPVFNEEAVVEVAYTRLKRVLEKTDGTYELIFVNDGSRDRTSALLEKICERDATVKLIDFSRNFGHQMAITAGMDYAQGEAIVVIDADLQDPPEVIPLMIEKWKAGYDVVYGRRVRREGETVFKKVTAKFFYRFLRRMTDVEIPVDTGDFRLIDWKVCAALKQFNERNRYVRGLISWLGFSQIAVEYKREERFAGSTKYPLKKMIRFALDALTGFSHQPLKLASFIGTLFAVVCFLYLIIVLYLKLFTDRTVPGWASILTVNLFCNAVVLITLGIIGEYIGRIYDEAKGRPLYIVRRVTNCAIKAEKKQAVKIRSGF